MAGRQSALEDVVDRAFWRGRRVLLSGHTGFKGAWLSLWLQSLGATVYGLALSPPTEPNLFDLARAGEGMQHRLGDIRDLETVVTAVREAEPEVVMHLAAQSLVRESYADPVGTFTTNIIGTAHMLEACRQVDCVRAVVIVTSDKCYENREWIYPYREMDPLGGHDPYAASKAGAEIVTASYRASFFANAKGKGPAVASVRAGNVIGGGDWSKDRLVPDCIRAFVRGEAVCLRSPEAVRPWLYVLEPLAGYLSLSEKLLKADAAAESYASSFNFGPDPRSDAAVGSIAQRLAELWGDGAKVRAAVSDQNPHEANFLRLDATKAQALLGWRPRLSLQETLDAVVQWYRSWRNGEDMRQVSLSQISAYEERCAV